LVIVSWLSACWSLGVVLFPGRRLLPASGRRVVALARAGSSGVAVEETAKLCDEIEAVLRQEIPQGQLQTVLDNIGLPNSGIKPVLQFKTGLSAPATLRF